MVKELSQNNRVGCNHAQCYFLFFALRTLKYGGEYLTKGVYLQGQCRLPEQQFQVREEEPRPL